jgi:hypothetical protein
MAAKKSAKKPVTKRSASTKPAAKAAAKRVERLAVKLLPTLPALDEKRRRAYRAAFTDAQCLAWGEKTKASNVLADGERAVGALLPALKKSGVTGYSLARFTWVVQLLIDLEDAIANQAGADDQGQRGARNAAVTVATAARRKLVAGLSSIAGGDAGLRKAIADRNEDSRTPHVLESSLTGLLQLALQWRRTEHGEVLADDAGLTDAFLSSVSAVVESLRQANEVTYGENSGRDSAETNLVEGRVLRELAFARHALAEARSLGETVPDFPALASLKPFGSHSDGASAPAPAAPSA